MKISKEPLWKRLAKNEKVRIVDWLLEHDYTCGAVGDALGSTKNAVVGYQHTNLPKLSGRPPGSKAVVPAEILMGLLPVAMAPVKKMPASPNRSVLKTSEIVTKKLAADYHRQCQHSDGCAYERLPNSSSCGRDGHDK